jgi:hypothetical protein
VSRFKVDVDSVFNVAVDPEKAKLLMMIRTSEGNDSMIWPAAQLADQLSHSDGRCRPKSLADGSPHGTDSSFGANTQKMLG